MSGDIHFNNFQVKPRIPETLEKLTELAYNVWSTWDKDAYELFSRIDPLLYRKCEHNPVQLLNSVSNERLEELSKDSGYLYELTKVYEEFNDYLDFSDNYYESQAEKFHFDRLHTIAYFCMEYGMHESIPVYSGGLGVLAGDYLKAASDQGLPMIAFGLLYKYGYFSQKVNLYGMQEEAYHIIDWSTKPLKPYKDKQGKDVMLKIVIRNKDLWFKVWKIDVGKIVLYLLDTDIAQNLPEYRCITDLLYDAGKENRILQEILLAYGSLHFMQTMEINPTVYHLNEGHSAFIILERLRQLINDKGFSYLEAKEIITTSTVFTTHTPIVEGNEHFDKPLIEKFLLDKIEEIGFEFSEFFKLGSIESDSIFWLPAFANRFSKYINGVSKLHSEVSKKMWKKIYPTICDREVPIDFITNGVHLQSWLSKQLTILFNRYIGPEYMHSGQKEHVWTNILNIPDSEIWEAHKQRKEQMISFIRLRLENIARERGLISYLEPKSTLHVNSLTIGFARRFAQYKRATLLLENPERLLRIIKNTDKPIQFIFAGKAHPADTEGKKLIKRIIDFAHENGVEDRFIFIEDYDMNVARHIVQGVDVWLNNPIKPMEASGTSGMKAGLNGVLNFSVLDGWWPECYDGTNGWAITASDYYEDPNTRQKMEANQIYDIIENELIPQFYDRDQTNCPVNWVYRMKRSMYTVGKGFNMHRMLREYADYFYMPSIVDSTNLLNENAKEIHRIISFDTDIEKYWPAIYIKDFFIFPGLEDIVSGDVIKVEAYVFLGEAPHELFTVELFYQYNDKNDFKIIPLQFTETYTDHVAKYEGTFIIRNSGYQGVNVRVRPKTVSPYRSNPYLIKWKE